MCEEEIQVRDSAEYPPVKVCEKKSEVCNGDVKQYRSLQLRDVCSQSVFLQQSDRKWQI